MLTLELIGTVVFGIVVASLVGYLLVVVNGLKNDVREMRGSSTTEHDRLSAGISKNSSEIIKAIQSASNDLDAAIANMQNSVVSSIKEDIRELRESNNTAHDNMLQSLTHHAAKIMSVINDHHNMQLVRFDHLAQALGADAKQSSPANETTNGDAVELQQHQSEAVATQATVEYVEPEIVEGDTEELATPADAEMKADGRIVHWNDLPEIIRVQWQKKITDLTIPPLSYDARHEHVSPKELIKKVKHDPMLCAKILAVANSAAQGQVKAVTSIERAAVQLGTNMLQIIISAYHMEAIFGHYPNYSKEHFSFIQRWSCGSSVIAYHIAAQAGTSEKAMLSTVALISRLGGLLLGIIENGPDQSYREISCEADRYDFEMEHWGISTPLLSERIASQWGLPEPMPKLLGLQERPLFAELSDNQEDRDLLIISLSAVITSAYLAKGGDNPLDVLSSEHCDILNRNLEAHHIRQVAADAWQNKGLQREFMSIIE